MGPTRGHSLIPGYRRALLPIIGDLRLGGHYQFEGNAGGTIRGCEPPRLLAVTWEMGGSATSHTISLAEDPAGGTHLGVGHVAQMGGGLWDPFGACAVGGGVGA